MLSDLKKEIISYIEEKAGIFTRLSDYIWENPELSLMEYKARDAYKKVLEENGFTVTTGVCGIETAVTGSYGKGRPVIGILGEYDALSGLSQVRGIAEKSPVRAGEAGHGCGHNMLGAGALAAAFGIKHYLEKSGHEGTVVFYGCPGEEGGAAKAFMAREGFWRSLDAALTWHPEDVNEVLSGTNNSTVQILYDFYGTASHAAGDPEHGRSALDAVELMNTGVQYLREHMRSDCRVHYAIIDAGGVSPNVVQEHASVLYMVRAIRVKDTLELLKRVDRIAEGACLMTDTHMERSFIDGTADLVPNFRLEELVYENFRDIPLPEYTAQELAYAEALHETCPKETAPGFAARHDADMREKAELLSRSGSLGINNYLMPLYHSMGYRAGSTDVGDVSWQTPTVQIHCAGFVSGSPGHSWQNVSSGGSSIGHKALLMAGKVLAAAAVDLYEDPAILKEARAEFEKRTREGYICPIEPDAVPRTV